MGVLAPRCIQAEILVACVCKVTIKHLPQPLRSHIQSFRTIKQLFKVTPISAQAYNIAVIRGQEGTPQFLYAIAYHAVRNTVSQSVSQSVTQSVSL